MTVKAVYENGVLKPKDPLPLKEREEVEIEIRRSSESARKGEDPRSFVGFIKDAPDGVPLAAYHDLYIDHEQYGHMKHYLRPLMASADWQGVGREEKLQRFIVACKEKRPDLMDLWEGMDRHSFMWADALEYCERSIQREVATAAGR
ncbi:MAG TPA: antitoxin family protein [Vicinamibacteria bacterium]